MIEYPARRYAWSVVAILIATAVLSFTDRQVLSLLVDPIRRDLNLGDTQMSLLLGIAFALVYGAAGIPLGYMADRVSRRNIICTGVAVWSCGTMACGLSHDFGQLFASRIVVGLGEGALAPAAIALISDYFPPQRRGTAVGLFLSGIAMGSGVAIFIGGAVLRFIEVHPAAGGYFRMAPWRMVFLLIGAPGLLWTLAILIIKEPLRRTPEALVQITNVRAGAAVPAWKQTAPLFLVLAAASFVDNAVGSWAPTLLIRNFSKDPAQIGLQLGGLLTVAFGGGVLIGGALADLTSQRKAGAAKLQICLLASMLVLPFSLLIKSSIFAWAMAGVPLYFALSGIVTAVGFSIILDAIPNESRGLAMSIAFFLNVALGAGLGPTAVVLADDLLSHRFGLGPPIVVTVFLGYVLAIGALLIPLRSFKQRKLLASPG